MNRYSVIVKLYNNTSLDDVSFTSKEQALTKLEEYKGENNKAYKFVALLDNNKNNVLRLLSFENGSIKADFVDSDIVKLRKGYYEPREEKYLYVVSNMNENTGRCLIKCINSGNAISTAENVDIHMIEFVSHSK